MGCTQSARIGARGGHRGKHAEIAEGERNDRKAKSTAPLRPLRETSPHFLHR